MSSRKASALRLWLELARIALPMSREMDKMLRQRFGQSLVRFDLMSQLARHGGGLATRQLADALLASTSGNISTLLDRMITEQLIERRPGNDDRRVTFIHLTKQGAQLFEDMAGIHERWIADRLMPANVQEMQALSGQLTWLRSRLDTASAQKIAS